MKTYRAVAILIVIMGAIASLGVSRDVTANSSFFDARVQLVKTKESPRIYAVNNGRRHLIRSPKILQSYAYRSKKVKIISAEDLDSFQSVELIKSSLGPRVYRVYSDSGQKLWYPTEGSFLGSGEKWKDIVNISGVDSRAYRNAHLIKSKDDAKVYYLDLDSVSRAPIKSEEDFLAVGFSWRDILVVPASVLEAYELTVDFDPDNFETPFISQSPPPLEPSLGAPKNLVVMLGPGKVETFPSGTSQNIILSFDLSAKRGDIKVRSLALTRKGFLSDQDITSIALVDQDGFLMTRPRQLVNRKVTFDFSQPLVIRDGNLTRLRVIANFALALSNGQANLSFNIESASDIKADAPVGGSFPIKGSSHNIIQANRFIAGLTVDSLAISLSERIISIGAKKENLNKFEFMSSGTEEDVLIERIIFTLVGGASPDNFDNYRVVDARGKVVAEVTATRGDKLLVTFEKPYSIPTGERKTLSLQADIVGGSGSRAQFVIEDDFDIRAVGGTLGYAVTTGAGSNEQFFPIGNGSTSEFNRILIEGGSVLVSANVKSPSAAITSGAKDAVLAIFDIKPSGQTLQWNSARLYVRAAGPRTALKGSVSIRKRGGEKLGSIDASAAMNSSRQIYLSGQSTTLASGKTLTVEVVGSLSDLATISDSYQIELSQVEFTATKTSDRIIFSDTVSAPARAVQKVSVLAWHDDAFTDSLAAAGRNGVKLGRFIIQVSAGETVRIEEITLKMVGGSGVKFSNGFSYLKLGSKRIDAPAGGSYRFAVNKKIGAGRRATFDLYVNSTPAADGHVAQFQIDNIRAVGAESGALIEVTADNARTPAITFKKSRLFLSPDSSFAGGSMPLGNKTIIGSFVLRAEGAEDIKINTVTVTEASGSAGLNVTRGYKNLYLTNADTGKRISSIQKSPSGGTGGDYLKSGFSLAPDQTMTINLVVDTTGITSGDSLKLIIFNLQAAGVSSKLAPEMNGTSIALQTVKVE